MYERVGNAPAMHLYGTTKSWMIQHLRNSHGHIDSAAEMAKWDRDELERAHIEAHQEAEVKS